MPLSHFSSSMWLSPDRYNEIFWKNTSKTVTENIQEYVDKNYTEIVEETIEEYQKERQQNEKLLQPNKQ